MVDALLEAGLFLVEDTLAPGGQIFTAPPCHFILSPPDRTQDFTDKEIRLQETISNILFGKGGASLACRHLKQIGNRPTRGVGLRLCGTGTHTVLVRETWMADEQIQTISDGWNPRSFCHEGPFVTVLYLVRQDRAESTHCLPAFRNLAAIA